MQFIFFAVAISGLLYFLLVKRRFDYFALAFFSSLVYFMPGFFGATSYHIDGEWSESPIHPETYGIMITVMCSIWFSAWWSSHVPGLHRLDWSLPTANWTSRLTMMAAIAGLLGLFATAGGGVFHAEKELVMENLGRWHILFYTAATLGLPIAFALKQRLLSLLFIVFLLFDLFLGFRLAFSVGILSVLVLLLSENGNRRLISMDWKIVLAVLLFAIFMFGYKAVAFAIRAGMWDIVLETLANPETYLLIITHSEPFLTQQTLNEIVSHRFETPMVHIYNSLYQFILFAPELGAEATTFNSLFQPALFPEIDYGLAANIWAQMWSAGGWTLLIIFIILFNLVLALGNWTLHARSAVIRAGLAPAFCYWAFYLHRNELDYALNLEKRQILLFLFVLMAAYLLHASIRGMSQAQVNNAKT